MTEAGATQPNPDLSTEREGDARRPSDTPGRGTSGTPGGNDQEKVEDRPNVSQVTPEDYPVEQRAKANG